jgi:ribosomal protein L11 methyltransferase
MDTYTVFAICSCEETANIIGSSLEKLNPIPVGIGIFELENQSDKWEIGAYFHEEPNQIELALLETIYNLKFLVSKVPSTDWVAHVRRQLTPVFAGCFAIYGSHDQHKIPLNYYRLKIEAAMAFGTGHHSTTVGCLLALSDLKKLGFSARNVADIGCGTGILAMAAAISNDARVVAADLDPIAVETTKINLEKNGFQTRVRALRAIGFQNSEIIKRAPFDLIFANILAKPLKILAKNMARYSTLQSVVVLSGILDRQSSGVEKYFLTNGFSRMFKKKINGWTTLVLKRN